MPIGTFWLNMGVKTGTVSTSHYASTMPFNCANFQKWRNIGVFDEISGNFAGSAGECCANTMLFLSEDEYEKAGKLQIRLSGFSCFCVNYAALRR